MRKIRLLLALCLCVGVMLAFTGCSKTDFDYIAFLKGEYEDLKVSEMKGEVRVKINELPKVAESDESSASIMQGITNLFESNSLTYQIKVDIPNDAMYFNLGLKTGTENNEIVDMIAKDGVIYAGIGQFLTFVESLSPEAVNDEVLAYFVNNNIKYIKIDPATLSDVKVEGLSTTSMKKSYELAQKSVDLSEKIMKSVLADLNPNVLTKNSDTKYTLELNRDELIKVSIDFVIEIIKNLDKMVDLIKENKTLFAEVYPDFDLEGFEEGLDTSLAMWAEQKDVIIPAIESEAESYVEEIKNVINNDTKIIEVVEKTSNGDYRETNTMRVSVNVDGEKIDFEVIAEAYASPKTSVEIAVPTEGVVDLLELEAAFTAPEKLEVVPTSSTVLVNGEAVTFDAYNINGNNYLKLRDVAYILNGTEKQFGVEWDADNNQILLESSASYRVIGGEMAGRNPDAKMATVPTSSLIVLDGQPIYLTAYNIDGNNYFKLRDMGRELDFGVIWNQDDFQVEISTSEGYVEEADLVA